MLKSAQLAFVVLVLVLIAYAERGKPPYINEPSLMRGARCRIVHYDPTGVTQHEGVFGELRSLTVTKTIDGTFVVAASDSLGCQLSFWTNSGEIGKPANITAISAY